LRPVALRPFSYTKGKKGGGKGAHKGTHKEVWWNWKIANKEWMQSLRNQFGWKKNPQDGEPQNGKGKELKKKRLKMRNCIVGN